MISFRPTASATNEETIRLVEEMLGSLNLDDKMKEGKIKMVCDAQLRGVAEELNCMYCICWSHNLSNMTNRAVTVHLARFLPGQGLTHNTYSLTHKYFEIICVEPL